MTVSVVGRIRDESYTRLLMEHTDLDLGLVMLLDRVQRGQRIPRDEHRLLEAGGLVEGRFRNLIVAGAVARATGAAGRHIRERGFDKRYYLDLILALVREHQPVHRRDVDETLVPKLPDRLTREQKRRKVQNLLQELRRAGAIENRGTRARPEWVALDGGGGGVAVIKPTTPRENRWPSIGMARRVLVAQGLRPVLGSRRIRRISQRASKGPSSPGCFVRCGGRGICR